MNNFGWWLFGGCVMIIGIYAAAFVADSNREKITLTKSQWHCMKDSAHYLPITTMAGKVPITIMAVQTQCDEYKRK